MVDSLQVAATVIVVFVLALAVEILFACCRVYSWLRRAFSDPTVVPPGRYRRGSVSHSWSEASVVQNSVHASPTPVSAPEISPEQLRGGGGADISSTEERFLHRGGRNGIPPEQDLLAAAAEARRRVQEQRGRSQEPQGLTLPPSGRGNAPRGRSQEPTSLGSQYATEAGGGRSRNPSGGADMDGRDEAARMYRRERRRSSSVRPNRLLFSNDFARSVAQDWQSGQFACGHCEQSLAGQRYILHDDRPYCKTCYEAKFANTCDKCKEKITCDFRDLSYRDRHWHDKCFTCSTCGAGLAEAPFAYKNERLHCATCYENNFAPRCTLCGAIFRAGMKKYEHRGRQWHAECFCCRICQKQIGTSSFIPRGDEVVCVPCYEKQYGQQCAKCNGAISKSGVMYSGRPWHRECFQCTHCRTPIGRDKFTTVKNAPYCVLCYGFLFAKKCYACAKPITGVEDSQFIAFDARQWHAACFRCVRCATHLVGRGFLTDDDDVMCPDCCRED